MTLKEISHLYFKSYKMRVNDNSYIKSKYTYFRAFKGYGDMLELPISSIGENDLIHLEVKGEFDTGTYYLNLIKNYKLF